MYGHENAVAFTCSLKWKDMYSKGLKSPLETKSPVEDCGIHVYKLRY